MKIFDFFLKYMGKMDGAEIFDKLEPEPEPEPKFLTSWSRSRTKLDRLRNTDFKIDENLHFHMLIYEEQKIQQRPKTPHGKRRFLNICTFYFPCSFFGSLLLLTRPVSQSLDI
jgi:hypothetical protein